MTLVSSAWIRPVLLVALLATACEAAPAAVPPLASGSEQATPAEATQALDDAIFGCPEPDDIPIPEELQDLTLPPGAVPVPAPPALPGEIRLDLVVPGMSVQEGMEFFMRSLAEDGHQVTFTDYEGFEAEVFFLWEGKEPWGVAWVLVGCRDGESTVSIRVSEAVDPLLWGLDPAREDEGASR